MILVIIALITFFFLNPIQVLANSLQINELMPHPSPGSDWIEIYNPTSNNIDLTNWTLVDSTSLMKTLSGSISANGFITFDVTNRLNNNGDSVYFKDSSGNTIDNYSYSSDPGINKSIGRSPDGGSWTSLSISSKGSANGGSSPSSTPSPTPTATPVPTSTTSPTSTSSPSSFTISNLPSQINSDESFTVSVNLSLSNNPSTTFYLKGAFKTSDGSNYFGLTKVSGAWIKNGSSYASQYQITTNSSGNWSGNLEVQPDSEDSGFTGTGDYIFKVGKYTSTGSGPNWSNEQTVKIIGLAQVSDSTKTISNHSPSPSSTISPSIKSIVTSSQIKSSGKTEYKIASIAGVIATATPSATPSTEVKSQKQTNFPLIIGLLLIISGLGLSFFIYLRNKKLK